MALLFTQHLKRFNEIPNRQLIVIDGDTEKQSLIPDNVSVSLRHDAKGLHCMYGAEKHSFTGTYFLTRYEIDQVSVRYILQFVQGESKEIALMAFTPIQKGTK